MPDRPPVVAVINTSPDIVDMLRLAFEHAGIVVVSAFTHQIREGAVDVEAFVRQHHPGVIVYDIAPPYASNWQMFQHVRSLPALERAKFVLTSTNERHVTELAGRDTRVYEIIGKPFDLDQIVAAVREATRARDTR
jgi:DNA-binding response OmpR family regulator